MNTLASVMSAVAWHRLPEEKIVARLAANIIRQEGLFWDTAGHLGKIRNYVRESVPPYGQLQKRYKAVIREINRQLQLRRNRLHIRADDPLATGFSKRRSNGHYLHKLRLRLVKRFAHEVGERIERDGAVILHALRKDGILHVLITCQTPSIINVNLETQEVVELFCPTYLGNNYDTLLVSGISRAVFGCHDHIMKLLARRHNVEIDRLSLIVKIDGKRYGPLPKYTRTWYLESNMGERQRLSLFKK